MGSYWSPENFSAMRPCYHCITPLYSLIWVIALVWGKAYKTHLNYLVVLQNNAMRIIYGAPPRTNMDKFYLENNILTVKHIYNYNIGLFMYKKMTPVVFDNFAAVFLISISMIQEMPQWNYMYFIWPSFVAQQEDKKLSNTVVLIFGISSLET